MNNKSNSNFSLRKLILTALVAAPLATLPAPLWALPSIASANLTKTSGVSDVSTSGSNVINVTASDKQVLTWVDFGANTSTIASGDIINYFLPSSSSSILNLVNGTSASTIAGTLASNGNVFVLNPNGITIASSAQINTGGFVATTVPDNLAAFSFAQNGTVSYTGTPTAAITVQNNTSFQAVGSGNNIKLYGKGVDLQGGSFFGNLTVTSYGGNASLASGANPVNVAAIAGSGGNLTVVTGGSSIAAGNVALGATSTSGTLTVTGNVSFDTTGSTNGSVTHANAAPLTASTSGTRVTINAGTGTSAGNVTIAAGKLAGLAVNGNTVAVTIGGADLTLGASSSTGNFSLTNTGNSITGSGNVSVGGVANLVLGNALNSFTATGNLTVSTLTVTSTASIQTSGDLSVVGATVPNYTLISTGGNVTTGAITSTSTTTVRAATDINAGALTVSQVNLTATGGKITSGAVTVSSTSALLAAGDISTSGFVKSSNNAVTVTSTGGAISLGAVTTSNNGSLSVNSASGTISLGNVTQSGNSSIAITSAAGGITIGNLVSSGNASMSLTSSSGSITIGTVTTNGAFSVVATAGNITSTTITNTSTSQAVTLTSAGSITNSGTIAANNLNVTSTAGNITLTGAVSSTTTTLNAFGDITATNAGNDFVKNFDAVNATRSSRVLKGSLTLITGSAGTNGVQIVDANDIVIAGATSTKGNVSITAGGQIMLGKAVADVNLNNTNGTDNLFFGGNLTLTASGTTAVTNESNVLAPVSGTINTFTNNVYVFGAVSLNTASNNNAVLGTPGLGATTVYSYGPINASLGTGKLSVTENTTLNLGAITAAEVYATSLSGDIINKGGALTVTGGTGTVTVSAGSIFSPGNVTLDNTSNAFTKVVAANASNLTVAASNSYTVQAGGGVTLAGTAIDGKAVSGIADLTVTGSNTLTVTTGTGGDYNIVSPHSSSSGATVITDSNGLTVQNATSSSSGSLTINAAGPITLGSGIALAGSGTTTFNSVGTNAGISDSAANIAIVGPVVFNSDNDINISKTGHSFGPVSLTTTGGTNQASVLITTDAGGTVTAVTLAGGGSGYTPNLTAAAATISGQGGSNATANITTNAAGQITAIALTGAGTGYTASLTNAAAAVPTSFTAYSTGVTTTAKTTNITYTEGATANLNVVKVNSNGSGANGNLSVTSTTGDIIQTAATGTISVPFSSSNTNPSNTVTFTAAGGVKIGNGGAGTNAIAAPVSITAGADSLLTNASGNAITLNGVKVLGGSFKAETTAANISEASGTTVFVFGQSAFRTITSGKITVANSGNNFGAISIASAGGDVSIKEDSTMNLAAISTGGGKFTAVSGSGIIETSNSYTGFTAGINPTGATSLTAAAGGIALSSNSNNFGGAAVTLTTTNGGNVSITDSNATSTILGTGTSVSGALTIRNTGNGDLKDNGAGNIFVQGSVLFDVGSGGITINGTGNQFGPLQFRGGSATKSITIAEATTMNLAAGSVANGQVVLSSTQSIITSGLGISSFTSGTASPSLSLAAGGNITISNPIFVQNGLSFQALGTVDLTALSLLGNLNNIAPTNLGAGTYKPPAP